MFEVTTGINWDESCINIADNELSAKNGRVLDVDSILDELKAQQKKYSTHSMNEHALFLQGAKQMLAEVIDYLEKI